MLGRELVTYIMNNHLMDKEVFEDGKLIGYLSDAEAAEKFDVGVYTIHVWVNQGKMKGIRVNDTIFVPCDSVDPRTKKLSVPTVDLKM